MSKIKQIEDEETALSLLSDVLDLCGTGKEIARVIDGLIMECLRGWCEEKSCLCRDTWNIIYTAKEVRNMFYNIE